jgi:hypothetical protein
MFGGMKGAGKPFARSLPVWVACLTAVLLAVACLAVATARPAVAQAAVARGIADSTLTTTNADATTQKSTLDEIHQLGAAYVRIFVSWALAAPSTQPAAQTDPAFDISSSSYMQIVQSAIQQAHDDGLKVIVTIFQTPPWASDSTLWPDGVYQPNVVMKDADLQYFGAFCQQFGAQFAGEVAAYECWNEPNLGMYLYPQRYNGDDNFAAEHYLAMLKAFYPAVRAGSETGGYASAKVIGGATAPTGINGNTPPQVFASWLAKHNAGAYFDIYSHHPYSPGGNRNLAPGSQPSFPATTVTLGNLSTLLKLFPKKPFWLTEYGYQTAPCRTFGDQYVDQITQASYLHSAYAYVAAHYPQVSMLLWFLVRDVPPAPSQPADLGFYTGLDTTSGAHKRAWFVFAGHNSLTITAPTSVKRGAAIGLGGTLRCLDSAGGKPLVLQSHMVGKPWANGRTFKTNSSGGFGLTGLRPKSTTWYRVSWQGVVASKSVCVKVR